MSNPEYGKITVDPSSWHAKVFSFGHNLWCNFFDQSDWDCEYNMKHADLCTYIRTILVKLPLNLLLIIGTYSLAIYTFLVFPNIYFPDAYWHFWGWAAIICIPIGLVITKIAFIFKERDERLERESWEERKERWRKENEKVSFFKLICHWIKDRHDRFCRLIDFKVKE